MVRIRRDRRQRRSSSAFGIGAIAIGATGLNTVRDEIAAQNITATDDAAELTDGRLEPGQAIKTGAGGEGVRGHHGAPRARVDRGRAVRRDGPLPDGERARTRATRRSRPRRPTGRPVENGLRNLWVTETALTTALNTSFFAERVAVFSIVMGIALLLTGIGFLVLTLGGALGPAVVAVAITSSSARRRPRPSTTAVQPAGGPTARPPSFWPGFSRLRGRHAMTTGTMSRERDRRRRRRHPPRRGTLRLRPPRPWTPTPLLDFFSRLSQREPVPPLSRLPQLAARLVEPFLEPDWVERGALSARSRTTRRGAGRRRRDWVRLRDPPRRRPPSPSRTRCRAGASARGCSSSSRPRGRGRRRALRGRGAAREPRDAGRLRGRRLRAHARARRAAWSRSSSRSRRPSATRAASTSAITSPWSPRCARSSSREPGRDRCLAARGSIGGELFRNVLAGDFAGAAYPVNREGEPSRASAAYALCAEIPRPGRPGRDLAFPGAAVLEAAEEALRTACARSS